ncbi:MAG: hypothetical protein AB7K52_07830 [Phycisphaerales bacterium]
MPNNTRPFLTASLALGLGAPIGAFAQQPSTPQAATTQAPTPAAVSSAAGTTQSVSATPIVVRAVKGRVSHRLLPDGARTTTKAGDVLSEGAEITTGINSAIEIQIGAGQVFVIDRVSRVILREAISNIGVEKTTLAVPYGRVQFEVATATVANDVQIQAPDATLAVKGTLGGLEVSPGFPTLGFGGDLNRGVFDVAFEQNIIATFRANERASRKIPNTARYTLEEQFVDINDLWSHEGDEQFIIRDFQTNLFLLLEINIRERDRNQPLDLFFLDEDSLDLYRADIFGSGGRLGPTLGADPFSGNGLALIVDQEGSFLFRLEDQKGPILFVLDLNDPERIFNFVDFISSDGPLRGLGAIGGDLYTVESNSGFGGSDTINIITSEEGSLGFGLFADPVMDLGVQFEGDFAGVTGAGTLVVAGRLPSINGFSNGTPGILGDDAVIFTVDPRVNYLRGAVSDLTADFEILDSTIVEAGLAIDSIDQVTGIALVSSPAGDPILVVTTRATVNGVPGVTLFNVFRIQDDGQTRLSSVGRSAFTINALASETGGSPPGQPDLAIAPSPSEIDDSAGELFAELAYSQAAVDSGVVERLIANQIVQTAMDPTGCAASMELATQLAAAISAHIDQRFGAGAAMFDFRLGLPPAHPCLLPGTGPSGSSSTSLLYYDAFTGDLHARTLAGVDAVIAPGQGELKPILGAATTPLDGGGRSLFTLVNQRGNDDFESPVLRQRNLGSDGTVGAEFEVDAFRPIDLQNGLTRSFALAGLGAIGSQLYAGGRSSDADNQSGQVVNVSDTTIYELLNLEGTPVERMVLPFDMQSGALAGAPTRGSIFALGSLIGTSGETGPFQLAGSGANAVLLEMDPRTNYLVAAHSADDGSFDVQPGTAIGPGVDPTALTRVTGMTYVGDTLVMLGVDAQGNQVIVQYQPGATNAPGDPRLRRLNGLAPDVRIAELGGETVGPVPGPVGLGAPISPIDTSSINRTFAQMAYSAQAAGSAALISMVREHIAATAIDPAGCRASAELNGPMIPGFLGQHINQQSGIGQSVFQFRNGLEPQHPCRPNGGPG